MGDKRKDDTMVIGYFAIFAVMLVLAFFLFRLPHMGFGDYHLVEVLEIDSINKDFESRWGVRGVSDVIYIYSIKDENGVLKSDHLNSSITTIHCINEGEKAYIDIYKQRTILGRYVEGKYEVYIPENTFDGFCEK